MSYVTPRWRPKAKRRLALASGNTFVWRGLRFGPCAYCGHQLPIQWLTLDHIYPKILGGAHGIHNLTLACEPCNKAKGAGPARFNPIFFFKPPTGTVPGLRKD